MIANYGTSTYGNRCCPYCGRCCSCTTGINFNFNFPSFGSGANCFPSREEAERARREREMEEALRRLEAWRASAELGRDYSPTPQRPPPRRDLVLSVSFHWMSQRKRAFKLRPSRPGWDRGR